MLYEVITRDALADAPGEGRGALAVEVAFEAMADRLVQEDAGPAGAEHHGHLARRGVDRGEVDLGLTHRRVDRVLPRVGGDEAVVGLASAAAERFV